MGPFTLLVGANASGKSNVREALRFLHAVGRGYTLAEIFGGKWTAGERQWDGILGGAREVAFRGTESFGVEVEVTGPSHSDSWVREDLTQRFRIEVSAPSRPIVVPHLLSERLGFVPDDEVGIAYEARSDGHVSEKDANDAIEASVVVAETPEKTASLTALSSRPVLGQLSGSRDERLGFVRTSLRDMEHDLLMMRFVDPDPRAMRLPSAPGQHVLSDRGENLSSVLQSLCEDASTKTELIRWIRLLTPMDVADLHFASDFRGEVLLFLVERDGTALSAYSASEGTLRFLALLAALLSAEPGLYFFEEIENGLHPSRLRLVLDLIRSRTSTRKIQVVATTHSPMLLSLLDDEQLEHASLVYRLEGERAGRIQRLLDVPDARRVLEAHDRADLLASGWFEDMVELASTPREPIMKRPTPGAAA
ncbi:MAG: ATP-binding protein [Polyangiaceae bacterium]